MTINILMMKKPESSSSCGGGGGGLYPWSTDDFRDELRDDLRLLRLLALKTIKNFGRFKNVQLKITVFQRILGHRALSTCQIVPREVIGPVR